MYYITVSTINHANRYRLDVLLSRILLRKSDPIENISRDIKHERNKNISNKSLFLGKYKLKESFSPSFGIAETLFVKYGRESN